MSDWTKLTERFGEDKIEWRVQQSGNKDGRPWAKVVPHPDARYLMDRLDEACGPDNWRVQYVRGPAGGVLCDLSIRVGEEWISKEDGAENTEIEEVKGGLTSAFKRACVPWNVGGIRALYHLDGPLWAKIHEGGSKRSKIDGEYLQWDPPKLWEGGSGNESRPRAEPSGAEAEPEPSPPITTELPENEEAERTHKQKVWAWFKAEYPTAKDAQRAWTTFAVRHPSLPSNPEDWDEMHCTTALAYLEEHGKSVIESEDKLPEQPSLV